MVTSLRLSGRPEGLAAILVGGLSNMEEGRIPWGRRAESIISDIVSGYDYPLYFGFPAGHITENLAFIIGKEVCIETENGISVLTYKQSL
jgi:muramoyltetrapeptide carboxypeptidase